MADVQFSQLNSISPTGQITPHALSAPTSSSSLSSGGGYSGTNGYVNGQGVYVPSGGQSGAPTVPSTIDGGALGNSNPMSVPNYGTLSSSNAFVTSLLPQGAQTTDSTDTPGAGAGGANDTTGDPFKKNFNDFYGGLISKLGLEGPEYQNLQQQYQIPQITQNLADIRGTIAQRTAGYTAQWQLANTEHAALPYITGEQTQIQRTQAVELGMLTAQEQALSGNLNAANDIVDRTIQHEFDPIKNMLSASAQWYQIHQNDLSESEKATFQLNSSLVTLNAQSLIAAKSDAYKTAIQYGAPTSVFTALANAKDTTGVYQALSGLTSGSTGDGNVGNVVNGYDLSTYATDPQYASKIANATSTMGTITTAPQAQQVIDASAKGSPVTGDMIATAATMYGVDPTTLAGIMKVESNFGTLGAGAKTNNPGNVGNTDNGNTVKYKTWQDGVNAVAQQLQNRKVSVGQALTQSASQSGTQQSQQSIVHSAPLLVQPGVRFTSNGTAYIDKSRLTADAGTMATVFSARSGIPVLDDADVKAVQGLSTAMDNINSMKANFDAIAPMGGIFGKLYFKASAPVNKLFDTDYGAALSAYQSNRDNLFQQISALAGSHPRINTQELITAANALPKLDEWDTDTMKDGNAKVGIVQKYLDNSMKNLLPTYKTASENPPIPGANGTQWQQNADGSVTRIK